MEMQALLPTTSAHAADNDADASDDEQEENGGKQDTMPAQDTALLHDVDAIDTHSPHHPDDDLHNPPRLLDEQQPIASDQFDLRFAASKLEIWAYYAWFMGNSSLMMQQYAPVAFQNLLNQAAGSAGVLRFAGRDRNINSIVLLANGISFSIQVVLLLVLGSFADFGTWRPNILIFQTLAVVVVGIAWLGVYTPDEWQSSAVLYIVGSALYTVAYSFWAAAFPSLARNTPALRKKAMELSLGAISRADYDQADSLNRSRLFNIAGTVVAPVQVVVLAVCGGILYALNANASDAQGNWSISVILAFGSAIAFVLALPWFFLEKRRPGQAPPADMSILKAGMWQWYQTGTQIWRLRQSLFYLIGYFLLNDALSTTSIVISTLQTTVVEYNIIKLNYLNMVGWATQFFGVYGYWLLQRKYGLDNKTMFLGVSSCIVLMDLWGLLGIWSQRIGFHRPWEFWLFQVWWGGFVSPYFSYSQIMISEITPRGHEFLFFSFFNAAGTTTSFLGPIISSAIIDASASGNSSLPFYFLAATSAAAMLIVWAFVDVARSRREQAGFLEEERAGKEALAGGRGEGGKSRLV